MFGRTRSTGRAIGAVNPQEPLYEIAARIENPPQDVVTAKLAIARPTIQDFIKVQTP
jgi:hypothetical protein